ncbi:MAG: prephenate/arogenate dehydrogenase family protein [Alphaproteobacteria bacterium]
MIFQNVTIIGLGLIGSSLARAIRQSGLAAHLTAADISEDVCNRVRALGLCDEVTGNLSAAVKNADLVIIAVPVGAYASVGQSISLFLKPGTIVTDVGSVKASAIEALAPFIPAHVHLVPGHPIAGTEHSGPEAGFAELFQKRWCILTPLPQSDIQAVEKITKLWEACGAMIEIMDAEHHDLVLGTTSHLPHLIAYTIVGTANALEDDIKGEVIKFSAGGFRDFTRIAASDPAMWRDVFLNNKTAVLEMLQRFNEDLSALQKAIRQSDGDFLFDFFTRTRAIRRAIIDQGQADYRAPGGVKQEGTPPVEAPHTNPRRAG